MLRRFYAVTEVVEPISASRRHFRRQSAISGAVIDVVARLKIHTAIIASDADGERESQTDFAAILFSAVYGGGENNRSGSISYNYYDIR